MEREEWTMQREVRNVVVALVVDERRGKRESHFRRLPLLFISLQRGACTSIAAGSELAFSRSRKEIRSPKNLSTTEVRGLGATFKENLVGGWELEGLLRDLSHIPTATLLAVNAWLGRFGAHN
jgi:hypothetical protein